MKNPFSVLVEEDSSGICHNIPNARYKKWEINSFGFRGREMDMEKQEGQIRIACLGGSETFGYYERKGKEWPAQLGEIVKDKFPTVEVINVSVAGLKLKKRKDYVEKYVLPLKPDIMIIFHQRFLDYVRSSMRGDERKHLADKVKRKKRKNPIEGEPCARIPSGVLPKLEEALKRCSLKWLFTPIGLWRQRRRIRRKEKKCLVDKEPMEEAPENMILEYERELKLFVLYLKEKNIIPVLSTYPTLITPFNKDIYENLLLAYRRVFCIELSENGILDTLSKLSHVNRKVAEEQNLVLTDNENLVPKTLEYFVDNVHFTERGAETVAKNFYYILNRSNLIK
jgi:hypothetical protein